MVLAAASPVIVSAATTSGNTTINATLASVISLTTSTTVALAVTPTSSGSATSASDTVTVATNNASGYSLTLADTDTNTALVNGGNNIAGHAGTFASPTTLANNSWGYRVDGAGTFGAGPTTAQTNQANLSGIWAGLPSSAAPQQLKTTATNTAGDATSVWYGVKVDTSKPTGTYTDSVTYTAVTN
ncbi:hypothetical protein A2707_04805 [Candidatus Saccharibacteria bacterium RIFCSPHIGHO2_01_FULL_45_15]|nr:MAG: hypothetical protein A2707_04805 [Candidatus Saccharibacteria bacterium RIFCSPHIGHO2_01_FULL_45_15]